MRVIILLIVLCLSTIFYLDVTIQGGNPLEVGLGVGLGSIVAAFIGCIVGVFIIKMNCSNEKTQQILEESVMNQEGGFIMPENYMICRTWYGDDKSEKPNNHCYWSDWNIRIGWYETDKHLKIRHKDLLLNPIKE